MDCLTCLSKAHIAKCRLVDTENIVTPHQEDLAKIAEQERELQFVKFDEEAVWSLGSRLRSMAVARKAVAVIDVRRFGQPLFYTALAGTSPDNVEWVRRKSNTVARFHRSSYGVGLELGASLFEKYALPQADYAGHGGSVSDSRTRRGCDWLGHRVGIAAAKRSRTRCRSTVRRIGEGLQQARAGSSVEVNRVARTGS